MLPVHGMVGCVHNFKLNGSTMAAPAVNRGVGLCFEGQMKSGAYFSGQGAHVIIGKFWSYSSNCIIKSYNSRQIHFMLLWVVGLE